MDRKEVTQESLEGLGKFLLLNGLEKLGQMCLLFLEREVQLGKVDISPELETLCVARQGSLSVVLVT